MTALDPFAIPLSGSQLIEAGAGTGKTYTIASIFIRLVLSGRPVKEILVVTFTEAATAELKDRLRRRLREALEAFQSEEAGDDLFFIRMLEEVPAQEWPRLRRLLQAALSGFDEAAVFTIHGFCLRVLQENAFESGVMFDAELSCDPNPIYGDIAADYWAISTYFLPKTWVRFLKEKKVTPGTLAAILGRVAGHPDRTVLPDPEESDGNIDEFLNLYLQARDVWRREREDIETLLSVHPGVNRRSYTKKNLPKWLTGVEAFLESDALELLPDEGNLGKFAQTRLTEMAGKIKGMPDPPQHRFFSLCDRLCDFGADWLVQFQRRFVDYGLKALAASKTDLGIRFFDDLIQDLDRGLAGPRGGNLARRIRQRYPVALIDEFQDTDLTQYRIFRTIYQAGDLPFFMIGDPKQSIYAFRGADVFAYLRAAEDAGNLLHTLTVNWRSDPGLIRAVNTLFDSSRVHSPFGMAGIGFLPATPRTGAVDGFCMAGRNAPPLQMLFVRQAETGDAGNDTNRNRIDKGWADEHLPGMVAGDICGLLAEGTIGSVDAPRRLEPGDMAVLVRTNRQGRRMQAGLRAAGLPTVLTSLDSVFESTEAFELKCVLQAVAAPSEDNRLFTAMATDFIGVSGNRLDALRSGDPEWEWWLTRFRDWHRIWQEAGFVQMMTRLFGERAPGRTCGFLMGLLSLADGERRVTNFQHLSELLQTAVRQAHLGPEGLLRWFDRQRAGQGEAADTHQLRLESDARAVRIVTIHKSKGLEYPVVYLPYLWDGGLQRADRSPAECHLPHEGYRPVLDLGSKQLDEHLALAAREQMTENLRLLYVALTRARHACRVVWGPLKQVETSALSYLIHRPEENDTGDFFEIAEHAKTMDEQRMLADLRRLADVAGGSIDVQNIRMDTGARYVPPAVGALELACRKIHRLPERRWRMESFSHLVTEAAHQKTPEEESGLDYDQRAGEGATGVDTPGTMHPRGTVSVPLAAFGKGADAGTFFHAIYEHLDFAETDPVIFNEVVAAQLSAFGFDVDHWKETVGRAVSQTLDCPLDPDLPELTLRRISNARRLNELAFLFPAADRNDAGKDLVTPGRLKRIFEAHASTSVSGDYGRRLGALRFPAVRGFLKGFMDLVFEFEGRWYLADYKSNHLGNTFADYGPDALSRVMAAHHYFLQYHIYLAALHRYLSYRLPDYDYDTHFGGVYYLFIRGMSKETGCGFGVFRDRPGREMVEGLSGAFE